MPLKPKGIRIKNIQRLRALTDLPPSLKDLSLPRTWAKTVFIAPTISTEPLELLTLPKGFMIPSHFTDLISSTAWAEKMGMEYADYVTHALMIDVGLTAVASVAVTHNVTGVAEAVAKTIPTTLAMSGRITNGSQRFTPQIIPPQQSAADLSQRQNPDQLEIEGGGGKLVRVSASELRKEITFPPWGSPRWFAPKKTARYKSYRLSSAPLRPPIYHRLNLGEPLERPAVYFWADVLTKVMPRADIEDPFKLSAMIAYAMKHFGGFNKRSEEMQQYKFDGPISSTIYGFVPQAEIVPAPPLLRHYSPTENLKEILRTKQLKAGTLPYTIKSHLSATYYRDMVGIFFTTPEHSSMDVGATSALYDKGGNYIDIALPKGTPVIKYDTRRGPIYLLIGPPGPGSGGGNLNSEDSLPYPPLKIPIKVVEVSEQK